MRRLMWALLAVIVSAVSCSSGDSATTAPQAIGVAGSEIDPPDPVATFCQRWDTYAEFSDRDVEPTEEMVGDLLDMMAGVEEVLPDEVASDWRVIVEWTDAFLEVFDRDGYGPVTDEVFIAAFGDAEAAEAASERTSAAYQAIYDWQGGNCPLGENDQAFCRQFPPYDALINSDPDVDEELIAQVLAMEEALQAIVPSELEGDLGVSIDWNTRFIDWFRGNDYQQPETEEEFIDVLGNEEAAEELVQERESAFSNINAWIDGNCRRDTGSAAAGASALPASFCAAWEELVALTADNAQLDDNQWRQLQDIVDRANADVPVAVADDWAAMADFIDRYGAVLVTVEFSEERITDDLLEQAFGSVDAYDRAVAAREAAAGAIAEWSLEGCGDFCARWPDMDRVRTELDWPQFVLDDPENGQVRLEKHLRTLTILDQLVPDELADTWLSISAEYRRWVDDWRQADFDPARLEDVFNARDPVEWARTSPHLLEHIDVGEEEDTEFFVRIFEAWQAGADQVPDWAYERWMGDGFDPDRVDEIREEIEASDPGFFEIVNLFEADELPWWLRDLMGRPPADLTSGLMDEVEAWVNANCGETTGRPGTLKVLWPKVEGYAGGTAVMALVPLGGTYDDLADVPSTLAAYCEGVNRDPWGVWIEEHEEGVEEGRHESDFFRDERWSDGHLCGFLHEVEPPRLDAGWYTLVGGIMWGDPGDPAEGFEFVGCLELDVEIDSDTVVDLPPFQPCDVRVAEGDPDPWRNPPPVDPSTPGSGTLRVELESIAMPPPFEDRFGGLQVVVVPAGTTLNEVGREQVWPVGAAATWLVSASHHEEEIVRLGAVRLPISALPPSGRPVGLDPEWLLEDPPEDQLPLTTLAPGAYDVLVQLDVHVDFEEEGWEDPPRRCGQTEVVIDGDTVIELPELGECP